MISRCTSKSGGWNRQATKETSDSEVVPYQQPWPRLSPTALFSILANESAKDNRGRGSPLRRQRQSTNTIGCKRGSASEPNQLGVSPHRMGCRKLCWQAASRARGATVQALAGQAAPSAGQVVLAIASSAHERFVVGSGTKVCPFSFQQTCTIRPGASGDS